MVDELAGVWWIVRDLIFLPFFLFLLLHGQLLFLDLLVFLYACALHLEFFYLPMLLKDDNFLLDALQS